MIFWLMELNTVQILDTVTLLRLSVRLFVEARDSDSKLGDIDFKAILTQVLGRKISGLFR